MAQRGKKTLSTWDHLEAKYRTKLIRIGFSRFLSAYFCAGYQGGEHYKAPNIKMRNTSLAMMLLMLGKARYAAGIIWLVVIEQERVCAFPSLANQS